MTEKPRPEGIIPLWFWLKDQMWVDMKTGNASALRPPSLRDACYAHAISAGIADPETVEVFVNGLELGAMQAIKVRWDMCIAAERAAGVRGEDE